MILTRRTIFAMLVALAAVACVVLLSLDASDAISLAGYKGP